MRAALAGALALAACAAPQPAAAPVSAPAEPSPWLGQWAMAFDDDPGWHHHALELTSVVDGQLVGAVVVDRSLGPEARAPGPDEATHRVALRVGTEGDGRRLRATVPVGTFAPVDYTFDLSLCPAAGPERCTRGSDGDELWIEGEVRIGGRDGLGVLARTAPPR